MNRKHILLIFFVLLSVAVSSQTESHFDVVNSTMGGTSNGLPFWLWANRDGKVEPAASFLNLTEAGATFAGDLKNKNWTYQLGTNWVGGVGDKNYFQINELYGKLNYKGWQMQAGYFTDDEKFSGLSTTNGNLARSLNARPYPKIRFSTHGFKPMPWLGDWLFFSGEYDEGLLDDKRYVDNAHLHHKSLYFKVQLQDDWDIQLGAGHFVMWGGVSSDERWGALPTDFKAYLKYILGLQGDEEFPSPDQLNVSGNQYGTWQLKFTKELADWKFIFNLSHPFDDFSGVNWRNWPDNLLGFYLERKNSGKLVDAVLYEFINTRHQGITDSTYTWVEEKQSWVRVYDDDYFNHGVYTSGVTYHQMAMVSPLFGPVVIEDGISQGFESTRFYAHHLGIQGWLTTDIKWKGLATYSHHLGRYLYPYEPARNQTSLLLEFTYVGDRLPFFVGLSMAADKGQLYSERVGAQLTLSKSW